jgi:hypothetical protein
MADGRLMGYQITIAKTMIDRGRPRISLSKYNRYRFIAIDVVSAIRRRPLAIDVARRPSVIGHRPSSLETVI